MIPTPFHTLCLPQRVDSVQLFSVHFNGKLLSHRCHLLFKYFVHAHKFFADFSFSPQTKPELFWKENLITYKKICVCVCCFYSELLQNIWCNCSQES